MEFKNIRKWQITSIDRSTDTELPIVISPCNDGLYISSVVSRSVDMNGQLVRLVAAGGACERNAVMVLTPAYFLHEQRGPALNHVFSSRGFASEADLLEMQEPANCNSCSQQDLLRRKCFIFYTINFRSSSVLLQN